MIPGLTAADYTMMMHPTVLPLFVLASITA
jgi:hypothetical protein